MTPPTAAPAPLSPAPDRTVGGVAFADDLARHGDHPAVVGDVTLSYAQLAGRVAATAERLGPVRRLVLLEAANDVDSLVTYLGALHGGHPVLLVPAGRADTLASTYRPDVVAARGTNGAWRLDEHHPTTGHDLHPDLAALLCTSGSTGSPRVVRLSHANLQANAESIADALHVTPDDRAATSLPMAYCYGLSVINSHLAVGATLLLTSGSVVDRCFWDRVQQFGATSFAGVPHTFDLLDAAGFAGVEVPSLRYVTQAGGRLAPERVRRFAELGQRRGWDFVVMYGQTEATARMAVLPADLAFELPDAIGRPIPGGAFAIEPRDADDAARGEGELIYSGPNVMLGYADSPSDLARGRVTTTLRTGDLARCSDDGVYTLVGRTSRFLKLFGLRVDLQRVEDVLAAELGRQVVCTGDDDHLVVAVDLSVDTAQVTALLGEHVGLPAHCVQVVTLDELPRLPNEKPDLCAIREAARLSAVAPPAATVTSGAVAAVFDRVLGCGIDVGDRTFVDLGGDSLSYVEVALGLEEALGDVPPHWHLRTVDDLQSCQPRVGRLGAVETTVALRAVGITTIVSAHAGLLGIRGAAHVLLGVAGFNLARFQLTDADRRDRICHALRSTARLVVPSVAFIGVLYLFVDDRLAIGNVVLANNYLADGAWRYWYWFVEALAHITVVLTAVLAIPIVHRWERARPFAFALGVLAVALALRTIEMGDPANQIYRSHAVLWCFALGWVAERARTTGRRVVASAVIVAAVPGFFAEPTRDGVVIAGLLALVWLAHLPLPRPLIRPVSTVAAASLAIYLTHWQVFPLLEHRLPGVVVTAVCVAVGVLAWVAIDPVVRLVRAAPARVAASARRVRTLDLSPVTSR